jgi:hypothetical protein
MRNGKIANLPCTVRDELNQRLENGEEGGPLLEWLNGLGEVRKSLQADFGGEPISKQNLSEWRRGGFREWQLRQEWIGQAWELANCANEMAEAVDTAALPGALAGMLAARYAALLNSWDGEPDRKFEEKLRLLRGLNRDIALLQRTMQRASEQKRESKQQEEEREQREFEESKKRTLDILWSIPKTEALAAALGGGQQGRELAEAIIAVKNDLPLPNKKEEGKGKKAESRGKEAKSRRGSQTGSKPVKATQSETSAVKPGQTESNPDMPSQTETKPVDPVELSQTLSNPVKPEWAVARESDVIRNGD